MTVVVDEAPSVRRTAIQDFYAGQNVFITGGTGFLGKILIEKLLRSCPELSSIYLLVRPKKGKDVDSRVEALFDDPVFSLLKKKVPKFRHKIVAVLGDCSQPGLGLVPTDRNLLMREVTVVFHVAATVRFDEKIKYAAAVNVSGTKEMMDLCCGMHNLKSVIHVSTAYSNCTQQNIDEKFYPPPMAGDNLVKLTQSLDDKRLETITPALLGDYPNTYAYTKAIAEDTAREYGKELPLGIFRPAIVISTCFEPVEGWIDNVYGPTGIVVGTGAGLLRTMNLDTNCTAEIVPVDLTVNALIASAWDVAANKTEAAEPPIYNYLSSWDSSVTWGKYMNLAFKYGSRVPSMQSIWCYTLTVTKSVRIYYLLSVILHLLPGLIIDLGLLLTGQKPRMLKLYKKIHKFLTVTSHFGMNKWKFSYNNTRELWHKLSPEDQKTFFFSMNGFDWEAYMEKCINGVRVYIFKDDPSTIPAARKRMAKILLMHNIIKYAALTLVLWGLYSLICVVLSFGSTTGATSVNENLSIR